MKGVRKAQNLRNRNDRNQNYNYICFQVENRLLRKSAEELNLTDETDMVELKETPRNSQSTKSAGQGTQKSTSAKVLFLVVLACRRPLCLQTFPSLKR